MSTLNVRAIERELTSLWKQAGEDDGGVLRACLLNLIVYSQERDARELDDLISEITKAHPCRAILIVANPKSSESYLRAEVTSHCSLSAASSKQVCCEQVTLESGGEQMNEVPSAVTPLLVSDLPVCLWWRAEPRLGDRLFKRLAGTSDRVIIDSADFNSPYEDLRVLATLLRERPLRTAYSDLNWARLTAWRALLAGFYDVPRYRKFLEQIDEVVIEYAPPSAGAEWVSPRALILAGWLASRLGWKLKDGRDRSPAAAVRFEARENDVVVEFRRTESEAIEAGRIALVSLSSAADSTATFNVKRSADRLRIETDINIGEENKIQRVLSYENHTEAQLIAREIEIQGRDRVFEEAALAAAEMIGQLH